MWHSSSVVYIEPATVNSEHLKLHGIGDFVAAVNQLKSGTWHQYIHPDSQRWWHNLNVRHYTLACGVFYRMWMFQVASMRKGVARIKGIPYVRIIMRNEKTSLQNCWSLQTGTNYLVKGLVFLPPSLVSVHVTAAHPLIHFHTQHLMVAAVLQVAGCSADDISSAPSLCRRRATFNRSKSANGLS